MFLRDGMVATHPTEEEGATLELASLTDAETSCFCLKYLDKLNGVATTIDLGAYPQPCIFYGANLRGAIIGIR